MSSSNELPELSKRILVMQIIAGAITMGAIAFLVVVLIVRASGAAPKPPDTPLLTYFGIGFAVLALAATMIVPKIMVSVGVKNIARLGSRTADDEVTRLCFVYQGSMIQGLALLEGATFFQIIAYLIEGEAMSVIAAGVLMAIMVLQFPKRSRVEAWIERQQEKLRETAVSGSS